MTDVIKAWLDAGEFALIDDLALQPRPSEIQSTLPLCFTSEHAITYCLVDEKNNDWLLKKFPPEYEPEFSDSELIRDLVPRMPGFESGFDRRVLNHSSLSPSSYYTEELQLWLHGAILTPQVALPTWANLTDSIIEGGHVLSRLVRLLICEKLTQSVEWLESVGLAHRDLSAHNVLIDAVNVEVHAVNWDNLYHPSLNPQPNSTCGTAGYIAPFVKVNTANAEATWLAHSDRFALSVLNSEIMSMKADSARSSSGGLLDQRDIFARSGQTLSHVRTGLHQSFPDVVRLLDQSLTASNFEQCPAPSDWLSLISRELNADADKPWDQWKPPAEESQSIYERPRERGFVSINESAFVKINWNAFASAPRNNQHR